MSKETNAILITIDCLRADNLGCYGYHRDTSPNINNLASKGALFTQVVSSGGGTPEAFPSILASLPPALHQDDWGLPQRSATLAKTLKGSGYQTAAFHSNAYLSKFYGFHQGFDTFFDNTGTVRHSAKRKISRWLTSKSLLGDSVTGLYRFFRGNAVPYVRAEKLTEKVVEVLAQPLPRPRIGFCGTHSISCH